MKGEINPDHIGVNNYRFEVLGLLPLTAVEISGIEDELETVDLPDRTKASGGNRKAGEFELTIPMHHGNEQLIMELWFREAQDPVLPTYKKPATLTHRSISRGNNRAFTIVNCFPRKRTLPDLEMENEGELANVVWTMAYDDILPI